MLAYRLARLLLHLFAGLLTCALVFPRAGAVRGAALVRRWAAKLLAICGVQVQMRAAHAHGVPHALIVANHVSWLDIFVIDALHPCRFVAKSDIRGWPLIGWLCDRAGTIFIARGRMRDVRRIYQGLVASLRAGERVAFFPEGTTGAQGGLLPFHANLFEAAIEAQVPVQPYALRYLDAHGKPHPAVEFVGDMSFAHSLFAILKAGRVTAQLVQLPAIPVSQASHRRDLADAAHASIAEALQQAENLVG